MEQGAGTTGCLPSPHLRGVVLIAKARRDEYTAFHVFVREYSEGESVCS
jgi:hypothetical protein